MNTILSLVLIFAIQTNTAPPGNSITILDPGPAASPTIASEFVFPVDPSTHQVTGYDFEVINNDQGDFDHIHPGEDWNRIGVAGDDDRGDAVFSIANGRVTFAGMTNVGYGNEVLIEHILPDGKKIWSQYAHLDSIFVKEGQRVHVGDQIGTMGDSGGVTNVHLHFEIRIKDIPPTAWEVTSWKIVLENYIDPKNILPQRAPAQETPVIPLTGRSSIN